MSYKLYDILLNSIQMNGSKIDCIFIHISQNDFQDGPIDSITDWLNICITANMLHPEPMTQRVHH